MGWGYECKFESGELGADPLQYPLKLVMFFSSASVRN